MRDVTVPWSYIREVPKPPIVPRLRAILEPAALLTLMLVPVLVPLLTPILFLKSIALFGFLWLVFLAPIPSFKSEGSQPSEDEEDASWYAALPRAGFAGQLPPL